MLKEDNRWCRASFRIMSTSMSIEEICAQIDIQAARYFIKGEHCSKRNPKSMIRDANIWILESELNDQESLASHIKHLLDIVKNNSDGLIKLQSECEFTFCCAYASESGQGGFTLDYKIVRELGLFPINLSIDLYPPSSYSEEK